MKRAFTLVELLVVIGIICILAGTLLSSFGGATESARATKCIANLKSLAVAANAHAMSSGSYPLAGSVEYIKIQDLKLTYREMPGWISWLSCDGQYGRTIAGGSAADTDETADGTDETNIQYPTSHQTCDLCPYFGTGDIKRDEYARANGSLWQACGRNQAIYICPAHERACGYTPVFSYVMNAKFGYDISRGTKSIGLGSAAPLVRYGAIARADRTLMFADIHMKDANEGKGGKKGGKGAGPEYDAVLNYKAEVNGEKFGASWDGTPEQIGFPHKGSHGRKIAHVVFTDGHTEKLSEPRGGALNAEQLTAILCEGKDFAITGKGYDYIDNK